MALSGRAISVVLKAAIGHPFRLFIGVPLGVWFIGMALHSYLLSASIVAIIGVLLLVMEASNFDQFKAKLGEFSIPLAAKRALLLRPNEYGIVVPDAWNGEKARFLAMHSITPSDAIYRAAMDEVERVAAHTPYDRPPNSGTAYEADCQKLLQAHGWTTWLTAPTGDKGTDIIAVQAGIKVAIQCKNYSSPVGTRAVQEIVSGREYEKADQAVVVSPAEFTREAKDLAAALSVWLLKTEDLATLYERLS